ncbi:hypothetical protein [Candidatus Odyssella acanthamoebae]|uniref:Uncharacterized protein n=1 Tax=Candidatus Odyssella acanthamoebae TaxID=91604 RepID=A0A077AR14_9PROT|nr:hypothetical protein [Candidatus Paracaedibacter acanthamoebae]AIK95627.1 hypothetical protein ID47_00990 [Candidatus Paracaedibacter acanthamoebae]
MKTVIHESTLQLLPLGDIEFFDNIIPPLLDDDYTITVNQNLSGKDSEGILLNQNFSTTQAFSVQGARFNLNTSSDIQYLYPASGGQGQFGHKLPQIVLTKRSLPWERLLKGNPEGTPWIALLLFDEDQVEIPETTNPSSAGNNPTKVATLKLGQIRNINENGILGPLISQLNYGQTDDMPCQAIDVTTDTFINLVPRQDELPYLAHGRQVNVGDKEILNMTHSGWFSVVISNRFPIQNPTVPTKQILHLVSLEGFEPYLVDNPSFPSGIQKIRLVSLASWAFTCLPETGETFSQLMLNLVSPGSQAGTNLLFQMPIKQNNNLPSESLAKQALSNGYVPINYQTLPGDQTFAWYRGPFSPVLSERFTTNREPFQTAAEAIIYDQATGLFNLSYAAAWQTGRLLALSNGSFAANVLNWQRQANQLVDLMVARFTSDQLYDLLKSNTSDVNQWLDANLVSQTYLNYLVNDFAQKIAPKVTSTYSPADSDGEDDGTSKQNKTSSSFSPGRSKKDTPPTNLVDELKKLLQQDNAKTLIQTMGGDELTAIVEWLARLYLLYGIPFNNLVPDSQMLPRESVRFFYLDRAWLDSLVQGAMSIGIHTSKDSFYYQITKDIIQETVDTLILQVREKLLGLTPSNPPSSDALAGFIFRSTVVSSWPGLEVKAYRTVTQTAEGPQASDPLNLLRMDRLAPDVLLCLFPEIPSWIELNEPKEGLCFGVEDVNNQLEIGLRNPADGKLTGISYILQESDYRPQSNSRVLNISNLQQNLAKQQGMSGPFGSADFALQMIDVPEQMVFQNTQST